MKKAIIIVLIALIVWVGYRTEINVGRCLNNDGDGKLYNGESYYNYICYCDTGAKENDIVLTIDLLNPFNTYCDDIVFRWDKIIFKEIGEEKMYHVLVNGTVRFITENKKMADKYAVDNNGKVEWIID